MVRNNLFVIASREFSTRNTSPPEPKYRSVTAKDLNTGVKGVKISSLLTQMEDLTKLIIYSSMNILWTFFLFCLWTIYHSWVMAIITPTNIDNDNNNYNHYWLTILSKHLVFVRSIGFNWWCFVVLRKRESEGHQLVTLHPTTVDTYVQHLLFGLYVRNRVSSTVIPSF